MEPDRGLLIELREACRDRDGAQQSYDAYIRDYKVELHEKKEVLAKARQRVQEIEAELVNPGQSDRPLLAAIAAAGRNGPQVEAETARIVTAARTRRGGGSAEPGDHEREETTDERQQGPTAEPSKTKAKRDRRADRRQTEQADLAREPTVSNLGQEESAAGNRRIAQRLLGPGKWTDAEIDECVEDACHPTSMGMDGARADWQRLRETGCDDIRILELLRAIWPNWNVFIEPNPPSRPGFTTFGGAVPKLWVGAKPAPGKIPPTLSGLQLAARVRIVLDLPRVPVPAAEPQPAPKRRKAVK
ncbi:MAG: hypothetical protein ACLQVD_08035 [Capsulimonadaceae bacterium]